MKAKLFLAVAVLALTNLASSAPFTEPRRAMTPAATSSPVVADTNAPDFKNLSDLKWDRMLPDLGDASPEICIVHVDPTTHATQLLIRTPKPIHVRKHWHSANETHTMIIGTATFACEGKRVELQPGGFNYMPGKMVHEAWSSAGAVVFITVDGAWEVNWVEGPPTAADVSTAR